MNLTEMKAKPINELVEIAESHGLEDVGRLKKQEIIFRIFKKQAKEGVDIYGGGVLEILNDGFGFLRSPEGSYCLVQTIYMFHQAKLENLVFVKEMRYMEKLDLLKIVRDILH